MSGVNDDDVLWIRRVRLGLLSASGDFDEYILTIGRELELVRCEDEICERDVEPRVLGLGKPENVRDLKKSDGAKIDDESWMAACSNALSLSRDMKDDDDDAESDNGLPILVVDSNLPDTRCLVRVPTCSPDDVDPLLDV